MEVLTFVTILALIWKITTTLKYLTAGKVKGAVTQLIVWLVGIAVIWLASAASLTAGLEPWPGVALGSLDMPSIVMAGLLAGSAAAATYDVKKAVDGTDSAVEPPLGG